MTLKSPKVVPPEKPAPKRVVATMADLIRDAARCNERMGLRADRNGHHASGKIADRDVWMNSLPNGKFTVIEAMTSMGCGIHAAQGRVHALATTGMLHRTPPGVRPVLYWRAE